MQLDPQFIPAWERLLARLELPETTLNMETYCDCLAGHALQANGARLSQDDEGDCEQCEDLADELLGLNDESDICTHVFYGWWFRHGKNRHKRMADISRTDAIAYVRKVIETRDPMVTVEV